MANGYNLYIGNPNIDYDTPVAFFASGESTGSYTFTPSADSNYKFALRATRSNIETPGVDCVCDFKTDGAGDWIGSRPDAVFHARLYQQPSGVITVAWDYLTGLTAAADFAIWAGTTRPTGAGAADATPPFTGDGPYTQDLTLSDGSAYYIRIVARDSGGIESDETFLGPLLADATAPSSPSIYNTQTF